jgi:uncharacterized protein YndB with AHSA1/START domain
VTDFGTVRRDGAFGAVRFERVYDAAPEQLWEAWTSPDRLGRWLGATVVGALALGAKARLVWGDDPDSQVDLVVTELTPPRLLEWQWTIHGQSPTLLRVELSPAPGGTLLVLDHARLPAPMFTGLAAGWHAYLDALAAGDAAGWEGRWTELLPAYRARVAEL